MTVGVLRLRLVLCTALLATARAVTYGEPGVASQYQLFGRPITDTSAIPSRVDGGSTAIPAHMPAQVLAVEGDSTGAAKAVDTTAAAKKKCDGDYLYSEVFGKCLPAPGKDGYIGRAEPDIGKGKGKEFVPIPSVAVNADMLSQPLRAIPMQRLPLRTAALNRAPQLLQPQPAQPPAQTGGSGQPAPIARVQQLRLACPSGFTFQPAMGACIAPAPQPLVTRRDDDDGDDSDDDSDDLRRELLMRARRRMRLRMFGRRFGGRPRILAPVFVFVLPPNALDRNATMHLGKHFARVHEVHPSLVGGKAERDKPSSPAAPSAPAPSEKPIATPAPAPATTDKPKDSPGPGTGEETRKALRGAFVNPIVSGSAGGKALPLTAGDDTLWQAQPLMGADSDALQRRAEFVSPFVAQMQTHAESAAAA